MKNEIRTESFVKTEKLVEEDLLQDHIIFERTYDNFASISVIRVYISRRYSSMNTYGYKHELGLVGEIVIDSTNDKIIQFHQGKSTMLRGNLGNLSLLMQDSEFLTLFRHFTKECKKHDGVNIKSIYVRDFILPDLETDALTVLEDEYYETLGLDYDRIGGNTYSRWSIKKEEKE